MNHKLKTAKVHKQKNDATPERNSRSPLFVALYEGMANLSIREALVPALEAAHKAFLDGDRFVLFDVVLVCATFQAVIPSWAVDELLSIGEDIGTGHLKDLNAAFGPPRARVDSRQRQTRLRKVEGSVVAMLLTVRGKGLALSAEYAFDVAMEELNSLGLDVSRRDVEDIYRLPRVKEVITNWPKGKPFSGGSGSAQLPLRDLKRTVRPLWEDKDTG